MSQASIPWDEWERLREDGYDLIYLMYEGYEKFSWEEWMEGFAETLKTSYQIHKDNLLAQEEHRKKLDYFLALILTMLEKLETLLDDKNRSDEAEAEIHTMLECLKDYVKHAIIINEGRIDDETGQSITGSAD